MRIRKRHSQGLTAVDLFSGAGGATSGYKLAGVRVVAAVDSDARACDSYELNHPEVRLIRRNIHRVAATEVKRLLGRRTLDILTACSPCTSYSTMRMGKSDPRDKDLALVVLRFARVLKPRAVVLENVPQLCDDERFERLRGGLEQLGYEVWFDTIDAASYGVPQRRRRLLLIAQLGAPPLSLPKARVQRTVNMAIRRLDLRDTLHRSRDLPEKVLARIRAVPLRGGSRSALPKRLRLACHDRIRRSAATNVYGRMRSNQPSPTLTTRCTTPSCGRFVHPRANRPITLREAACLQTFPRRYQFAGTRGEVERQIGNALPAELARRIALHVGRALARSPRRAS